MCNNGMFAVVEFAEEDGGGLSVVNTQWVTPRKKEVFWPPTKDQNAFVKLVRKSEQEINTESWKLYAISRFFYETDDYEKANEKLKQAEVTSDLQTDTEQRSNNNRKRNRIRPLRFDSDSESEENNSENKYFLPRPPQIKKLENYTKASQSTPKINKSVLNYNTTPASERTPPIIKENRSILSHDLIATPSSSEARVSYCRDEIDLKKQISGDGAFQVLLTHVIQVKEQNKKILALLEERTPSSVTITKELPEDFPVNFPLNTLEDLNLLENYIQEPRHFQKLVAYLSAIGGTDLKSKTNRILKKLFTNELATRFNFFGRSRKDRTVSKKPFSELNLCKVVIDTVKAKSGFTSDLIESAIKAWLKHAPKRTLKETH